MLRRLLAQLVLLVTVFVARAAVAAAASGDAAAEQKINEAINQHYFNTNFEQAENVLMSAVQGCGSRCSSAALGRLWMYVGLVRINGKEDRAGAVQAFRSALAVDPAVTLDESLVSPAATSAFSEAGGGKAGGKAGGKTGAGKAGAGKAGGAASGAEAATGAAPAGPLSCKPEPRDVSLGEPIPISCTTDKPAVAGTIFFMEPEASEWVPVPMRQNAGALQGIIPCRGVAREGTVRVYVELRDSQAKVLESFASKSKPLEFTVLKKSPLPAPSLPGQPPPAHCKKSDLKKAMRGTRDWGDSCASDGECKSALCVNGSCDSCSADKDCPSGKCNNGQCALLETEEGPEGEGGEESESKASGGPKKNWVGLHGALDFTSVGGKNACDRESQNDSGYACFYSGSEVQFGFDTLPNYGNEIPSGFVLASERILFSYDRLLGSRVTVGGRIGFAVASWAPSAARTGVGSNPLHLEARLGLWLGKDPLTGTGLWPYLSAGAGYAAIHAKNKIQAYSCQGETFTGTGIQGDNLGRYAQCAAGGVAPGDSGASVVTLDAYTTMGSMFLAFGGGAVYAFTPSFGLQLNLNVMIFLPTSGFAIEPSLGPVLGF